MWSQIPDFRHYGCGRCSAGPARSGVLMVGAGQERDEDLLVASSQFPHSFVALYYRTMPGLLRYFARRTLDAQVALDLTAETLAEAFASRARFRDRGDGSATAWLYTIAGRQFGRYLRRLRVEDVARRRLGMQCVELGPEDVERVETLIDFEEIGRAVSAAFDELRTDQREALRLRVIEGRSYVEVAAELGCSEDVARSRVSRGLRRLAAELDA
jgi:RNA polymerase sigma factor (sigma-70 family)